MYNFNFEMTYREKDNETYQNELLKALKMKSYDTKIMTQKIQILFDKFKLDLKEVFEIIKKKYKVPFKLDDFTCFQILFSWENLDKTHTVFKHFFINNKFEKNIILEHLLNI